MEQMEKAMRVLMPQALSIFSTWYLERQIRSFNEGLRENHPGGDLLSINDEDIQPLADYIAEKTSVSSKPTIQGDIERGEFVYQHVSRGHENLLKVMKMSEHQDYQANTIGIYCKN